jgi:hypothetical protein
MKIQRLLGVTTGAVFTAAALIGAAAMAGTLPNPIPVPPIGKAETKIIAFSKDVRGDQVKISDVLTTCPDGTTQRDLLYRIQAPIVSGKCDEFCSDPALNGTFQALIRVKRRESSPPKRGCLKGDWRIINPVGQVVASGTIVGTVMAGTHSPAVNGTEGCERCDEPFHFEGYLEGSAAAKAVQKLGLPSCFGRICATCQGIGLDPDHTLPGTNTPDPILKMRIEGALFTPCK